MSRSLLSLLAASLLSACTVGAVPDDPAVASYDEPGAQLGWAGFASTCGAVTPVSFGANLSILLGQDLGLTSCSVSGDLHVPGGIRIGEIIEYVHFFVASDDASVRYHATMSGRSMGDQIGSASDGSIYLETSLADLGRSVCASGGDATLHFTASLAAEATADGATPAIVVDSVDMMLPDVARCAGADGPAEVDAGVEPPDAG